MHRQAWSGDRGTERAREAGGMEDLQTDVMRFMAILAFCLMAVFALVQSLPTQSEPPTPSRDARRQNLPPPPPATPTQLSAPEAQRSPKPRAAPAQAADPAPRSAAQGFALRFASDAALQRLVRSGGVKLYALAQKDTWRLSPGPGGPAFARAAAPERMHVMNADTVPARLVRALLQRAQPGGDVTWGVTLPDSTAEAISRLLRSAAGGTLVIQGSGDVHREDRDQPGNGATP